MQPRAVAREQQRGRAPDARPGAGDHHDLARETACHAGGSYTVCHRGGPGNRIPMAGIWRLLLATPEAVPAARHALREMTELDGSARQVVELLVSELVTNAVRHGASDPHESILVRAHRTDGAVRVEVCDEGDGFDQRGEAPEEMQPGGRGLLLVD